MEDKDDWRKNWTITKQEIKYPIAPTPQPYQAQDGQLGTLLSAMFPMGKKRSMTSRMQLIGDMNKKKQKRRR